jgi:excisionase family DNA binding protein
MGDSSFSNNPRGGTPDSLLTIKQVARMLQVPVSWVCGHTRGRSTNRIPGFRLGKYWRFQDADVRAWLECQRKGV